MVSLLTILWALHPVNIESVLLLTNYNALLGYFICFFIIFFYINRLLDSKNQIKPYEMIFIGLLYLPAVFIAEYTFIISLLIFCYSFGVNLSSSNHLKIFSKIKDSFLKTLPLIAASCIFILSFLLSTTSVNLTNNHSIQIVFERVFWFAPQVIFHLFKLLIFPIRLSVDQSLFVKFGKSYFDPYSILCISFVFVCLILALISVKN